MTKMGADISHHQVTFDAARYQTAGHEFVILKATEGGSFTDPAFTDRWLDAGRVGLPRGCYHFARPGGATVDAQADHYIALMRRSGFTPGDVWCLDLEDAGGRGPQSLLAWADRWCEQVRAALGGPGLLYSYPHFVRDQLGNPGRIPGGCLGWWARYASDPYAGLFRPGGWPDPPSVWQCSNGESGCVTDVASVGHCDFNRMTDAAFAELFGGQEADMLTDDDKQWIAARLEESERRVARYVDHGDAAVTGSGNHHVRVREDVTTVFQHLIQISAKVDALKAVVDGIALGRLEGDLDVTGLLHLEAPVPPPPVADVDLPPS